MNPEFKMNSLKDKILEKSKKEKEGVVEPSVNKKNNKVKKYGKEKK